MDVSSELTEFIQPPAQDPMNLGHVNFGILMNQQVSKSGHGLDPFCKLSRKNIPIGQSVEDR
jgi:hypothetical protein